MGYGITSQSQLIDINTIKTGVENFKQALCGLERSGVEVEEAGNTCNAKALSVDGSSLSFSITDLGVEMKEVKKILCDYADELYSVAKQIYNQQVSELNEYLRVLAARKQQSQTNK